MKRSPQSLMAGRAMLALGTLHTVASFLPWDAWVRLFQSGVFNAAYGDWYVATVFWSFIAGPLMICVGWMLARHGAGKSPLGRGVGVLLTATALFGAIVWPAGGFWLVVLVGLYIAAKGS